MISVLEPVFRLLDRLRFAGSRDLAYVEQRHVTPGYQLTSAPVRHIQKRDSPPSIPSNRLVSSQTPSKLNAGAQVALSVIMSLPAWFRAIPRPSSSLFRCHNDPILLLAQFSHCVVPLLYVLQFIAPCFQGLCYLFRSFHVYERRLRKRGR